MMGRRTARLKYARKVRGQIKGFSILNQKNAGCAASRNAGTAAAAGKYLLFLDADDKMDEKNAIRSMVRQAEKEEWMDIWRWKLPQMEGKW